MVWVPQWGSSDGGSPRLPILRTPPFFGASAASAAPEPIRAIAMRTMSGRKRIDVMARPPTEWVCVKVAGFSATARRLVNAGVARAIPLFWGVRKGTEPLRGLAVEKGPAARRRPKAAGEAYLSYVEPAAEGGNEADGPLSAASREIARGG